MRAILLFLLLFATGHAGATAPRTPLRVLLVGNSLSYVNDLPAMLTAVAASQPDAVVIETTSFMEAGGSLSRRWLDGAAVQALRTGHWDAVVLQERGGVSACLVDEAQRGGSECRASLLVHRAFADLARVSGARLILVETWYPTESEQSRLHEGTLKLARRVGASVVHAGDALQTLARRQGRRETFPDGLHPAPEATLVMAAQLYRALSGLDPAPAVLRLADARLPATAEPDAARPLEQQRSALPERPTVFTADAVRALYALAARYR